MKPPTNKNKAVAPHTGSVVLHLSEWLSQFMENICTAQGPVIE